MKPTNKDSNQLPSSNQVPWALVITIPILINIVIAILLTILWNLSLVTLGFPNLSVLAGICLWFFFVLALVIPFGILIEYARSVWMSTQTELFALQNSLSASRSLSRMDVINIVESQLAESLNLKEDEILALIEEQVQGQVQSILRKENGRTGKDDDTISVGSTPASDYGQTEHTKASNE